ncbi:hypothetical protein [Ornithinimicrobium sp. CNJ-824]|uniref:hypothetical protein n=1 Tax=Ornithinimicrobium sp. CNJ-824 TaxID=1904966 RepID=UPI00117C57D4|nr:hypothetical protein [Ornithinimicrobium sp. CNJ-824]
MTSVPEVLTQLRADRESGLLAARCADLGIDLLVLFGSSVHEPETAGDVDLAYLPGHDRELSHLDATNALQAAYGDLVDVMPLGSADPVARFRALHDVEVLAELTPGAYAHQQMFAFRTFCDTQRLRDQALAVLAR